MGRIPAVDARWNAQFGRSERQVTTVDAIYAAFMPLQKAKVADHAAPILNAIEVVNNLKEKNVKIGSCSATHRSDGRTDLAAADYGYLPDNVVATDDLPQGGDRPFMALKKRD